jgi:ArsR family transcriptional regulator, arsenate/arsenite/antimonite-responsive transcriptional repressor
MVQSVTLIAKGSPASLSRAAEQFKAMGDLTRLELMLSVAASQDAAACICDLTPGTGLAQSTVSHHMKLLVEAGLLDREQRGKWAYYSLTKDGRQLLKYLG